MNTPKRITFAIALAVVLLLCTSALQRSLLAEPAAAGRGVPVSAGSTYTAELSVMGAKITFKVLEVKGETWIRVQDLSGKDAYWLNTGHVITLRPAKPQ
jgi:hypothetical protein